MRAFSALCTDGTGIYFVIPQSAAAAAVRAVWRYGIWIRTVFIMNIHHGVAMRSDVAHFAHLRDGISCLRELGESLGKETISKREQKELKRKVQVIVDAETVVTNDLHSQVSGVSGTGGSKYVARRLATEQKYSALASPTQSVHWQRTEHQAQSDKENRLDMTQTPVRSRIPLSAHSSTLPGCIPAPHKTRSVHIALNTYMFSNPLKTAPRRSLFNKLGSLSALETTQYQQGTETGHKHVKQVGVCAHHDAMLRTQH